MMTTKLRASSAHALREPAEVRPAISVAPGNRSAAGTPRGRRPRSRRSRVPTPGRKRRRVVTRAKHDEARRRPLISKNSSAPPTCPVLIAGLRRAQPLRAARPRRDRSRRCRVAAVAAGRDEQTPAAPLRGVTSTPGAPRSSTSSQRTHDLVVVHALDADVHGAAAPDAEPPQGVLLEVVADDDRIAPGDHACGGFDDRRLEASAREQAFVGAVLPDRCAPLRGDRRCRGRARPSPAPLASRPPHGIAMACRIRSVSRRFMSALSPHTADPSWRVHAL